VPTYIGLLRAVNLGGDTRVGMEPLRDWLSRMGYENVRSLLNSGNVVFGSTVRDSARIERELERRAIRDLHLTTDFFVRSAEEWHEVISRNPFVREAADAPGYLQLLTLKSAPSSKQWRALDGAIRGRERVRGDGRQAYIVFPDGVGGSKLTAALIERQLGTRGTMRNWNTVRKLARLAGEAPDPSSDAP